MRSLLCAPRALVQPGLSSGHREWLPVSALSWLGRPMGFMEYWDLSYDEINELLTDNPSLRSFVMGYAAEVKCKNLWFDGAEGITNLRKEDDHDRLKKGDISFDYKGHAFAVEVKSLQTASIRRYDDGAAAGGSFQCDASDKRPVFFADGSSVDTTCLLVGEFDLLAVNLHSFYGEWRFAFAKNDDLPRVSGTRGASKFYTPEQREMLLATSMKMANPPMDPYRMEPWSLLDELIAEREAGVAPAPVEVARDGDEEVLVVGD